MLSKLNSLLRITCVLFLIAPTSIALADEVWEWERFEDNTFESAITISNNPAIYCNEQNRYGTKGCSLALNNGTYTFTFSTDIQVYEVAFLVGAVNNSYSVTWYYADNTSETENKSGQDSSDFANMYDDFYKSFTDYNAVEENTDKYITAFDVVLTDISLLDTLYWQYDDSTATGNFATTTTTTSSTTTTSTTTTTTTIPPTTTTTTLPPKVQEVYVEPEPLPPPPEEIIVDIVVEGVDKTYTQADVNDGTIERDQERIDNEKEFGCFMTNAQIERGDCIIIIEVYEEEDYEEEYDTEEELFNDVDVVDEVEDKFIEEEFIELTEQEIEELEKQMEFEVKELELKEEVELFEFDSEEEAKEFIETFIEVEEFLEELEEVKVEEIVFDEIPKDIIIEIEDEIIEDELVEEVFTDESEAEKEVQEQVIEEEVELTEEEIQEEVAELEEVIEEIIVIDIPEVTEEELEEYTEEELIEYEEAKEEAIEEFVEELETEEVVEILEEINDVGVENLAEVSEEVVEVVAQVVEEVITIAQEEVLTEEQTEVVAEVLGFTETEDVQIVAEAVKTDENVAQAVDEFVERAVEFAKNDSDQEFTLADATTEIAFESFVASPVSVIIDIDLDAINLSNIANDMTTDQKEKAQEVIVPTILVRIVSFAMRRFD